MAKKAWSDPKKNAEMLSKIPMGRFAGLLHSLFRLEWFNGRTNQPHVSLEKFTDDRKEASCHVRDCFNDRGKAFSTLHHH